jgi:hypothetical protein
MKDALQYAREEIGKVPPVYSHHIYLSTEVTYQSCRNRISRKRHGKNQNLRKLV